MLSENSPSLTVSQPKGWLTKPLTFDCKEFFKSLGKAALKGLTGNWTEALSELPNLVAAIGIDDKPEDRAWVLIRRALARAALILLQEYYEVRKLEARKGLEPDAPIEATSTIFMLSPDFFDHPENSDIIPKVTPAFASWLQGLGIPEARARNIADRLRSYFALAVHNEWRSNPESYRQIREALLSPFSAAVERAEGWRRYRAFLASQVDEPVFGEFFSLRQIYVAPRGYFTNKELVAAEHVMSELRGGGRETFEVVSLLPAIIQWIGNWDPELSILVLSGGPGSGKSSLTKMLSDKLANDEGVRVVLVPLYKIDVRADFKGSIGNYVVEEGYLTENPLDGTGAGERLLLILDGLDELEMQGRATQEVAQAFIRDVVRAVDRLNSQDCRIHVLISGRELSVQAIETEFRKPGQVLHLLPYHLSDVKQYNDPTGLLSEDQRDLWWQKYGDLTGSGYSCIPDLLKRGEIGEVTAQPLLNYLVALSYRRGGLTLDEKTNLNSIYGDLVRAVYEREWAPHVHPAVGNLTEDTFIRLLEEVALAVWHGDGRTTPYGRLKTTASWATFSIYSRLSNREWVQASLHSC